MQKESNQPQTQAQVEVSPATPKITVPIKSPLIKYVSSRRVHRAAMKQWKIRKVSLGI